jgi:hypothetical protein
VRSKNLPLMIPDIKEIIPHEFVSTKVEGEFLYRALRILQ